MVAATVVPLEELEPEHLRHELEISALVELIDHLEWQLVKARAPRPIRGGPPATWDGWIVALPDPIFASCLGPKPRQR